MLKNIHIFEKGTWSNIGTALCAAAVVTIMYSIPYITYFSRYGF